MRVVNLVWRHLATIDGALAVGLGGREAALCPGHRRPAQSSHFRKSMELPELGSLAGEQPASVDDVLASYDHSNTVNLFALGALVAWLRGETAGEGMPETGPRLPVAGCDLAETRCRRRMCRPSHGRWYCGSTASAIRIRSSWRACTANSPMPRSSSARSRRPWRPLKPTARLRGQLWPIGRTPRERAKLLGACDRRASGRRLPARSRQSVSAFVDHAIGKMVTICRAIRQARGLTAGV